MAHQQQIDFCKKVKDKFPEYFTKRLVVDIGALDINGNNQYLFEDCLYIGVDISIGRNVDIVTKGHELKLPNQSVDTVISTECLEHDQFYVETLNNIYRMLKPGGMFIFTCATTGRPEHGTRRTNPEDAPFLMCYGDWGDYYKNLEEKDIKTALGSIDDMFSQFEFSTNDETYDIYFWGIKAGLFNSRQDYSFILHTNELENKIAYLTQILDERNREVTKLTWSLNECDRQLTLLTQTLDERNREVTKLTSCLDECDKQLTYHTQSLGDCNRQIKEMVASKSWRITEPLRWLGRLIRGKKTLGSVVTSNTNKVEVVRNAIASRSLNSIARFLYHRIPLPLTIKWRIREIIYVFLSCRRNSNMVNIKQSLEVVTKNLPVWTVQDDPALIRIMFELREHCQQYGSVGHILALPFLSTGGAESVALNFAQAIRELESQRSVIILVTDRDTVSNLRTLPTGIKLVVLDQFLEDKSYTRKQNLVKNILVALEPIAFHNINSEVAWKLIIEEGSRLSKFTKLFASIFAFQFGPGGGKIGYAAYFLKPGLTHLSGLLSDNRRFISDAIQEYELNSTSQAKMRVVYNPCRILDVETTAKTQAYIESFASRSPSRRLRVLWAGRLDEEKRVDLMLDIICHCRFADFYVYGQQVVNCESPLPNLENLISKGPFSSPQQLVSDIDFDAFFFTSKWEGMPNIILEVGALGIPVIAPTVGGVGELILENSGYPLSERPTVAEYEMTLRHIAANPNEAAKRAAALVEIIKTRHNWEEFIKNVIEIPGYFSPREKNWEVQR